MKLISVFIPATINICYRSLLQTSTIPQFSGMLTAPNEVFIQTDTSRDVKFSLVTEDSTITTFQNLSATQPCCARCSE
jgi:hypothetical protein